MQRFRLDGKPGWHLLFAFGRTQPCKLGEMWWRLCRCENRMATLCGESSCYVLSWVDF